MSTDAKPRQPYRLIVNSEENRMDVLTIQLSTGRKVLPVFSHEEEAGEFVRFGSWGTGWRVKKTSARELVSVLFRPGAGIGWVALDPWPGIHVEMVVGLVGVGRRDFVGQLVGGIEDSCSTARGDAVGRGNRSGLRCLGSEGRNGDQHPGEPVQAEMTRNV
jgi:SseB protein N-terminal domain